MKREEFIVRGFALIAAGISGTLIASSCNDDDDMDPGNGMKDCLENGTIASIGANHGHSLTVSKADVDQAVDKTYSIQGNSSHGHSVTITAAQFTELKTNNSSIQVMSTSGGGHTHSVTVSCA